METDKTRGKTSLRKTQKHLGVLWIVTRCTETRVALWSAMIQGLGCQGDGSGKSLGCFLEWVPPQLLPKNKTETRQDSTRNTRHPGTCERNKEGSLGYTASLGSNWAKWDPVWKQPRNKKSKHQTIAFSPFWRRKCDINSPRKQAMTWTFWKPQDMKWMAFDNATNMNYFCFPKRWTLSVRFL